jgi:carbamoyl-phosphate synthase large subunit
MEVNILFLSAGRRVELIKCFKKAKKMYGISGKLIAADVSETAPAIYFADSYHIIPKIGDCGFIDSIINICLEENIKLVIPTIDTELLILSKNKKRIEEETKARVLVSDENVIEICRDKYNSQNFFEAHGFGVPKLVTEMDLQEDNIEYPLFIKPLNGSSSINAFKIENDLELIFFKKYIKQPIIQKFAFGDEYTVDAFLDFNSNPITIVPRRRLATRSGEISKGLILKDKEIIDEVKKMLSILRPIGHVTIQCLKTNEGIKFIEINPRFGGGAPMSIAVGANSPLNLYKLLCGEELTYTEDYEDNILALRFDDAIYLDLKGNVLYDKGSSF